MNILNLFKNSELKLIEKKRESGDKYVFHFERKSPMNWKAGHDGIFTFKDIKFKGKSFRMFSVASSVDEENIIIATNIIENPSEFKSKLNDMQIGDSIFLRGPFGSFFIHDYSKEIALIAGGIGITPMRAILKDLEDKEIPIEVTLFYIDSKKDFIFKDELEAISLKNPKIKIIFLEDRKIFQENLSRYVEKHKNNSLYFISGSPKMVKGIRNDIKNKGVKGKNIKNHKFLGYK